MPACRTASRSRRSRASTTPGSGWTWKAPPTRRRRSPCTSACASATTASASRIQAYLRRSAADIARLLPLHPAIRLVKGAYDEPAEVAYRDRGEVDANYQALAALIAEAAGRGEARLALGTHDTALIERITTVAEAGGVPRSALEVHMLYGIRTDELRRLHDAGHPRFSLVAYGSAWYRWYMRRLAERPANVVFALRQLVP